MTGATVERLGRGVYVAPYLHPDEDDCEVLIAIDSRGRARKHVKLRPGVSEQRATDWLRTFLDRIDPQPKIELVREATAPAPSPKPPVVIDGRAYWDPNDIRLHRRFLARAAAARMPGTR